MRWGLLGGGNMAEAMVKAALKQGLCAPETLWVSDISQARCADWAQRYGVHVCPADNHGAAEAADILLLAVKPQHCAEVLQDLQGLRPRPIVSIVTGWTTEKLKAALPSGTPVLRVVPNTPCLVGEGLLALSTNHDFDEASFAEARAFLAAGGRVELIPEALMDAVTGLSGSGPAFVYVFIEAMADAGVRNGLTRGQAYRLAAQTVLGAGKMVLETGLPAGALKDQVTSPSGTTIEGIRVLEAQGMRSAVFEAVTAATERARELGKS